MREGDSGAPDSRVGCQSGSERPTRPQFIGTGHAHQPISVQMNFFVNE